MTQYHMLVFKTYLNALRLHVEVFRRRRCTVYSVRYKPNDNRIVGPYTRGHRIVRIFTTSSTRHSPPYPSSVRVFDVYYMRQRGNPNRVRERGLLRCRRCFFFFFCYNLVARRDYNISSVCLY